MLPHSLDPPDNINTEANSGRRDDDPSHEELAPGWPWRDGLHYFEVSDPLVAVERCVPHLEHPGDVAHADDGNKRLWRERHLQLSRTRRRAELGDPRARVSQLVCQEPVALKRVRGESDRGGGPTVDAAGRGSGSGSGQIDSQRERAEGGRGGSRGRHARRDGCSVQQQTPCGGRHAAGVACGAVRHVDRQGGLLLAQTFLIFQDWARIVLTS